MDIEQWRTVVIDGEVWDNYEVSNQDGKVRNRKTGKILKQQEVNGGYLRVDLCKNGEQKHFRVHRIVAEAFIPNPENKPTVNHINENKHDNRVENLEWATYEEQVHHGTRTERQSKSRQKRIRCVETGQIYESIIQAERETGLPNSNIVSCCRGKKKTCGGFHWEYVD